MSETVRLTDGTRARRIAPEAYGEIAASRDDGTTAGRIAAAGAGPHRPVLLAVDEDTDALGRIERELRKRYGEDYRVVCEGSTGAAMARLRAFEATGEEVAVVLADQWMSGMSGTEFLASA